jgi:hypothetical protein
VATSRRLLAALSLGPLLACSTHHPVGGPAPSSPEATVGQFLAAVNANDHARMAALWGDERGPSSEVMHNAARRDSLMTIYQHWLVTDSVRVLGSEPLPGNASRRLLRMELFQGEKRVTVPFTLAPQRDGGWLVMAFDPGPLMPAVNAPPRP